MYSLDYVDDFSAGKDSYLSYFNDDNHLSVTHDEKKTQRAKLSLNTLPSKLEYLSANLKTDESISSECDEFNRSRSKIIERKVNLDLFAKLIHINLDDVKQSFQDNNPSQKSDDCAVNNNNEEEYLLAKPTFIKLDDIYNFTKHDQLIKEKVVSFDGIDNLILSVLRCALIEKEVNSGIDKKVIINEYIEITKIFFGRNKEYKLINGVLHAVL